MFHLSSVAFFNNIFVSVTFSLDPRKKEYSAIPTSITYYLFPVNAMQSGSLHSHGRTSFARPEIYSRTLIELCNYFTGDLSELQTRLWWSRSGTIPYHSSSSDAWQVEAYGISEIGETLSITITFCTHMCVPYLTNIQKPVASYPLHC